MLGGAGFMRSVDIKGLRPVYGQIDMFVTHPFENPQIFISSHLSLHRRRYFSSGARHHAAHL